MYGHGLTPQQPQRPASGALIALRVVFVAIPLLTCSFAAWAPLLRIAVLTRRTLDWVLFGVFLVADLALLTYITVTADKEAGEVESLLGVGAMMTLVVGSVAYYLVAEIQHYARQSATPPPVPPYTGGGYGYPPTAATVPSPGLAQPYTAPHPTPAPQPAQAPQQVPPQQVPPQPVPQTPQAPQRIDQVRAELDELSDLLRKEEGK
ncbi:hypothetical protein [Streptomyces tritici]|uniref:hypothetical protein n=1 Tax=Streptomyces tritici TaxID=2054410 RepID=UPI003AF100CE